MFPELSHLHDVINYVVLRLHVYLQLMLGLLVLWIIFKKKDARIKLSKQEEEERINKWQPVPLVKRISAYKRRIGRRIVDQKVGKYINVDGKKCLNLATHNYLGFSEDKNIEECAVNSVKKYGVGSCGPRGFYGTVDVHLELEERLAKFFGLEEAVVYSYGFSTLASAIPAYAKRGDVIFVDENVNFAIQKGLDASRSDVRYFKHNDIVDLERLLCEQSLADLKNPRKAEKTRRFLIVEGIYMKSGDICPLPDLISLSKKYKLRIFIDESISFGTLGKGGRGVTEHFNIPVSEVDLIMSSLEFSLASVGGFCVGSSFIVEHQRLSGLGYCFSASLPPLLTSAAIKALDILEKDPQIVSNLQEICSFAHDLLTQSSPTITDHFHISGDALSPIKHLRLKSNCEHDPSDILELIVKKAHERSLAITTSARLDEEKFCIEPSIRLTFNRLLTTEEVQSAVAKLEEVVLNTVYSGSFVMESYIS